MGKHWIARIDDDGTLLDFDPTGAADGIAVPENCDLKPGAYRWDAAKELWEPIIAAFPKKVPAGFPDHLVAIALGLRAVGRTVALPQYTQDWLKAFDRYPDADPDAEK